MKALALILWLATPAAAALTVDARVNRPSIPVNEQLVLTVVVSGDRAVLPAPQLPPLPLFNVHNAGKSTNFSLIHGKVSSTVEYTFILVPRLIGKSAIGPVTVSAGQEQAQSEPIEVTILRQGAQAPSDPPPVAQQPPAPSKRRTPERAAAPQRGPDMFVTASLDKTNPYVNEQTILTVRFHTAIRLMGDTAWTEPETKGMLSEELPAGNPSEREYQGRRYLVSEVKMALFPIQPGKLEVGPSTIKTRVPRNRAVDPFAGDFFQQFFSQGLGSEIKTLQTRAIALNARRLPDKGKPSEYGGAVGNFTIHAELDRTEAQVGDALNLTVKIEGSGNLNSIGDLELPPMPEFRIYETAGSLEQAKNQKGVHGSKVFKTVLTPKVSGKLTVPPLVFSFFDPAPGAYRVVKTKPFTVAVEAGAAAAGVPMTFGAQPPAGGHIIAVSENIRYLHDFASPSHAARLAALIATSGGLTVLPAFLLIGSAGWSFLRDRQLQDPARARRRAARGRARGLIREARKLKEGGEAAAKLTEALTGYLGAKLDRSPSGLTLKEVQQALQARSLADERLEQLRRAWRELERIRFAPSQSGGAAASLAESVGALIDGLEEDLKL